MFNDKIIRLSEDKMRYFNYSENTIKIYKYYISEFIFHFNKQYIHITSDDYTNYLLSYSFTSVSQQNQIINALKFLYEKVLNKKYKKIDFERPRKERRLPKVINKDYLISQLSKIENIKHKAILTLAYSTGMRRSELINLKIKDINSKQMIIYVVQGKGKKDRIVNLSQTVLELLRVYYLDYKPNEYLFNGESKLHKKYSGSSINAIVKKYLGEEYHIHLLRHSCFTSMLEAGVDLRTIQSKAGHNSSKTTEIYTHVSTQHLSKIYSPI